MSRTDWTRVARATLRRRRDALAILECKAYGKYKRPCTLRHLGRDSRATTPRVGPCRGVLLTVLTTGAALTPAAAQTLQYPPAPPGDVVDDYHGTKVADPYRWLEDPDAPATRAWIEAQNRLTETYLAAIPARERIRERLRRLWDHPKSGAPFHNAGRYFFFKNDGLQNKSVLYTQPPLTADPT